ncbi:ATP-binding protein [Planobispora takensis]|nr:ATP-binding protein [Planobispora takensis]
MTGLHKYDLAPVRTEISGWERWLSMLDHVLPPSGLPPWSDGEERLEYLQLAVRAIPQEPGAPRVARRFTAASLRSWELDPLVDDTNVVVSELVTNALRHGMRTALAPRPAQHVRVVLCRTEHSVLCAVTDPSDQGPRLREPGDDAESGRGLQVVQAISQMWGWSPLEGRGKAVWAAFALPTLNGRRLEACR